METLGSVWEPRQEDWSLFLKVVRWHAQKEISNAPQNRESVAGCLCECLEECTMHTLCPVLAQR